MSDKPLSKEEVLAKHEGVDISVIEDSERILIGQDVILPAMQEYATLTTAPLLARIEELEKENEKLREWINKVWKDEM